jgi:predicted amidohydrolase
MIIALASPRIASTIDDGLEKVKRLLSEASAQGAEIVCFPEAYLPGLRGQDFEVAPYDQAQQEQALQAVAQWARTYQIAAILGLEKLTGAGRQIAAFVFDDQGQIQGCQTKNQLAPTEEKFYVPGDTRQLFEVNGVKFGVAICHEGWRYPETVRWAAVRGARIVFHPQLTGGDREGVQLTQWGCGRWTLLREGDDDAQPGEHDLFCQRQLCRALPGIGDQSDRSVRRVPGALTLW